jgi:uncharacterized protein YcgI (DUF1989 family)
MNVCREIIVPPMSAMAFNASSGQIVRIIDAEGGQPGDFVAFKSADLSVKLSQARTRVENGRIGVTQGHKLWTNRFPPKVMFSIISDTCGAHDLLYPPCCRYALEKRFGISRDGCLENLVKALKAWRVKPHEIPDPLNLFFRVSVDDAGGMVVCESMSKPGSSLDLQAEMDCIVAVATCSIPFPAKKNSGYHIRIFET